MQATATTPTSAFSRNFPPVAAETHLSALPVIGKVPEALQGSLLRIGPNPLFPSAVQHWFSGNGMLHAFHFEAGEVRYENRWVRTQRWLAEKLAGASLSKNLQRTDLDDGAANTNIVVHAGRLLALEEGHLPVELRLDGLATVGQADFDGAVVGPFTAHPKSDQRTGELLFFGYGSPNWLSSGMRYGVIDAQGKVQRYEHFEAPFASMVHDFAISEQHVIFPIMPLTANLDRARAGGPAFAWEPELGGRLGVMRRDRGVESLVWWKVPACYVYHVMNAWEADGLLNIDVMQAEAPAMFPHPDGSPVHGAGAARPCRWTLDPSRPEGEVRQQWLGEIPGEFPRIDDRFNGLAYRHGWYTGNVPGEPLRIFNRIVHLDARRPGSADVCEFAPQDAVSEAVFVPRAPDAAEGEGCLLAVVFRGDTQTSDLVIFDALDLAAGPVATVRLPLRVPNGFHGNWFDAATLRGLRSSTT